MKIPVICTEIGGNNELAQHYKTAITVKPNNSDKIYEAIFLLLNNYKSEFIKKISRNAYQTIKTQYSLKTKTSIIHSIYQNISKI